ncbi:MAG: hypothetical protein RR585_15320, partial [Coprobacillus sp.]
DNVWVTYAELDKSKFTNDEKASYEKFYSENPELISKGKLFDLKFSYFMENDPLNSCIVGVKKTSSQIDEINWEISFQVGEEKVKSDTTVTYVGPVAYLQSFRLDNFYRQRFNEDNMTYPKINLENLKVVITYPGGKEVHKLKLDKNKLYESIVNYNVSNNSTDQFTSRYDYDDYFNALYEYDFNRWKSEIREYIKKDDYISYNLLKNVYNERDFSDKDPNFIYQLLKDQILSGKIDQSYEQLTCLEKGCFQNDTITFHYQVGETLSLLYEYIADGDGKQAILDHYQEQDKDILALLKQMNNQTMEKNKEKIIAAVTSKANYFEILYGIYPERYAQEYTAYIEQLYPIYLVQYTELKDMDDNVIGYKSFIDFLLEIYTDEMLMPYILDDEVSQDNVNVMKSLIHEFDLKPTKDREYVGYFKYLDHSK